MEVFKVNHLIDHETIDTIYVFFGKSLDIEDPTELFKTDPTNAAFQDIFSQEELDNIAEQEIKVVFSNQQIHFDDTIGIIKLKIINEFSNTFSIEQIYLFCMKEEQINPMNVYQLLTQKERLELTRIRLDQFLLNINKETTGEQVHFDIPEKEIYDYEDILNLNFKDKKYWVSKVLGEKNFIIKNEYPFICNPFEITEYDGFIERAARKSLTTLNSHLLLNTGKIISNNIYLCLANDVLQSVNKKNISEESTIKIYYPFLHKQQITTLENLEEKQYELIEQNNKLITANTLQNFTNVDLFYDLYKFRNPKLELKYIKEGQGITFIKMAIHPEYTIKIPLDVIFKLIHATNKNPLIKYNPASRQENIYKLYANNIAKDGRKIPFLPKAKILSLMRDIGKNKSVSIYFHEITKSFSSLFLCDFEENGTITITCEFERVNTMEVVIEMIKEIVNPIIQEIKEFLEQRGFYISLFENVEDENVEIVQLNYQTNIGIVKNINL